MSDVIRLTGLKFDGRHGVHDHERESDQPFVVDVTLRLNTLRAGTTDALEDTVDYSAVARDVGAVVAGPSRNLIETLAEQIAQRILSAYPIDSIEVTVHKPAAQLGIAFSDVSVTISRSGPTS